MIGLVKWFTDHGEPLPVVRAGRTDIDSNISVDVEFNNHELAVLFMLSVNSHIPAEPFTKT